MKRKMSLILFLVMAVLFNTGCVKQSPGSVNEKDSTEQETKVEKQVSGEITLDQKGFYTYEEDYSGDICAMIFCSYTNNTSAPVKITDISFGLTDSSGVTLGTSSNTFIEYAPEIVGPGQTGYAVTNASKMSGYKITNVEEPTDVNVRIESKKAGNSDMTKILNTGVYAIQISDTDYSTTMTCIVENPSPEIAYYNTVVGGLYDSNSKLIGCLYNLSDSTQIGPNEKAKYSLNGWMAKSNIFQNAVKASAAGKVDYYEKDTIKINN